MPSLDNPTILREIIMDHYQYPRNHKLTEDDSYKKRHMASDSCIDDITVQSKIEDGIVKDICFDGVACTIATSSTSIMSEMLIGKDVQEAMKLVENYFNMVEEKDYDEDLLEEAIAFRNVSNMPARVKCALLAWHTIEDILNKNN